MKTEQSIRESLLALSSECTTTADLASICGGILRYGRLLAFGSNCRLREIELYLYADWHSDPYTHRHQLQSTLGQWYIHRAGNGYRNGSFKGLDFTFGRDGCFGGVLIRSLETAEGELVCGPSLCVDHLIHSGGFQSVKELDQAIANENVWDPSNPLHFTAHDFGAEKVHATARVGLTCEMIGSSKANFVLRRYRFLNAPRDVKKGRVQLILAMAREGATAAEIRSVTGSPLGTIEKYLDLMNDARTRGQQQIAIPKTGPENACALEGLLWDQSESNN